jgi:hypothetical protein
VGLQIEYMPLDYIFDFSVRGKSRFPDHAGAGLARQPGHFSKILLSSVDLPAALSLGLLLADAGLALGRKTPAA